MKIKRFEISGLFNREGVVSGELGTDLSIMTGRNGAGKTTILKLLWYVVSGNILLALQEIDFARVTVETDLYICTVHRRSSLTCRVEISDPNQSEFANVFEDVLDDEGDVITNAEDLANDYLMRRGSSVFFPTFRRIEGGFSMRGPRRSANSLYQGVSSQKGGIEDALVDLSRRLSNNPHVFVTAISTVDITQILMRKYADLSETYNELQEGASKAIIARIKEYRSDKSDKHHFERAESVLDEIRSQIEDMEAQRESVMTPMNEVRKQVERLFRRTGINFGAKLSFGDAASAVSSDSLSAGEKQMLSFVCYNAFYSDSVIFIDEPELSLHVDWQRQLFPMLQAQQSSNQFIVATHSPFIYSKYPDKELSINSDRGDLEFGA